MRGQTRLSGKTALVTGGAQRLGRETCGALAESGVNVAIHYNASDAQAEELAEAVREAGVDAWTFRANFDSPDEAERLVPSVLEETGSLDYVINNASIFPEDALHDVSAESLSRNINVNALSPFAIGRAFAASGARGCIVNLLDARVVDFDAKHASYHLSKRMLFSMTKMMAAEFAPAVRVNAVAPGLILPPHGEDESYLEKLAATNVLNAYGNPGDVADAILFLLGSAFVTGQTIFVDGGRHLRGNFYG